MSQIRPRKRLGFSCIGFSETSLIKALGDPAREIFSFTLTFAGGARVAAPAVQVRDVGSDSMTGMIPYFWI